MCDAYCYSISALKLAVLFLTFSFSVWVVATLDRSLLTEDERTELDQNVHALPVLNSPTQDLDPLEVEYKCSTTDRDLYTATNIGSEALHFACDELACRTPVHLSEIGGGPDWNTIGTISKYELLPGESGVITVPIFADHNWPFKLSLNYGFGKHLRSRTARFINVGNEWRSFNCGPQTDSSESEAERTVYQKR